MNHEKFFTWCRIAVKGIKYRPERDQVHKELYEHLEDRYESFRSRGCEQEEAVDKTIEAMGSAEDLSVRLTKIHSPFWLYMLRISSVLLIIAILFTLNPFIEFVKDQSAEETSYSGIEGSSGVPYNPYEDSKYINYEGTFVAKKIQTFTPTCSGSINGYPTTVTKAVLWKEDRTWSGRISYKLFLRLEAIFPYHWTEFNPNLVDIGEYIWAEDSLGNYYYSDAEWGKVGEPSIIQHHGIGEQYVHIFDLTMDDYVSLDAEWIDLHYDRDGRDYVLRIELPGGDGA